MILVVGAALASILVRDYVDSTWIVYKRASPDRLLILVRGLSCCLAFAGMVALIPIRLLGPRPPIRRLLRQPGFAACCSIVSLAVIGSVECLTTVLFRDVTPAWKAVMPFQQLWEIAVAFRGPFVVAGAWLFLLLSDRWGAEASWVDRLGRVLGVVWLIWLPVSLAENWFYRFLPSL